MNLETGPGQIQRRIQRKSTEDPGTHPGTDSGRDSQVRSSGPRSRYKESQRADRGSIGGRRADPGQVWLLVLDPLCYVRQTNLSN